MSTSENGQARTQHEAKSRIAPEAISAVKLELLRGFGGETENPNTDYDEVAEAVIRACLRVQRP